MEVIRQLMGGGGPLLISQDNTQLSNSAGVSAMLRKLSQKFRDLFQLVFFFLSPFSEEQEMPLSCKDLSQDVEAGEETGWPPIL